MTVNRNDLARYILWAGLLYTANANRKKYNLPTTWVFHTIGNTFSLLLPEIYRGLTAVFRLAGKAMDKPHSGAAVINGIMHDLVLDNPRYFEYVAPAAVAYVVSHPDFNIYKGSLSRLRLMGFGLDAIPHFATAFSITNAFFDFISVLHNHLTESSGPSNALELIRRNDIALAFVLLAVASALYESGEYAIHNVELRATRGDESRINMEWDVDDTVHDILSNFAGWFAAVLLHKQARLQRKDYTP